MLVVQGKTHAVGTADIIQNLGYRTIGIQPVKPARYPSPRISAAENPPLGVGHDIIKAEFAFFGDFLDNRDRFLIAP